MLKQVLEETFSRAMNQGNTCYKTSTNGRTEGKKLRRLGDGAGRGRQGDWELEHF